MQFDKQDLLVPIEVQFEITNNCNHKCRHCYLLDNSVMQNHSDYDKSTTLRIVDKIIENKIFNVIITGGEPLLNKPLCKEIIIKLKENGIKTSINTNLTSISKEFIFFLKDVSIDSLLISCPASNNKLYKKLVGVDNFELFKKNYELVNKSGIKNTVNMVVTKDNQTDIIATAQLMKELGCKSFAATPMGYNPLKPQFDLSLDQDDVKNVIYDLDYINKNLKIDVDIMEVIPKCLIDRKIINRGYNFIKRKCSAGRTIAAISNLGEMRPCAHNKESYGNIISEDMKVIWSKMEKWRHGEYLPEPCKGCGLLNSCRGGCRINAVSKFKEYNSVDPWMVKPVHKKKKSTPIKLDENTKFKINQSLRYRLEKGNSFLVQIGKEFMLVNKTMFDLTTELIKFETITLDEMAKYFRIGNDNSSFLMTIRFLISKEFLKIIE